MRKMEVQFYSDDKKKRNTKKARYDIISFGEPISKRKPFYKIVKSAFAPDNDDLEVYYFGYLGLYEVVINKDESVYLITHKRHRKIFSIDGKPLGPANDRDLWDIRSVNYSLIKNLTNNIPCVNIQLLVYNKAYDTINGDFSIGSYTRTAHLLDEAVKRYIVEQELDKYINDIALNVTPYQFEVTVQGIGRLNSRQLYLGVSSGFGSYNSDFILDKEIVATDEVEFLEELKHSFATEITASVGNVKYFLHEIQENFNSYDSTIHNDFVELFVIVPNNVKSTDIKNIPLKEFLSEVSEVRIVKQLLDWTPPED